MSVTEKTPAAWRVSDGTVPLSDVLRSANLTRSSAEYALSNGLLPIVRQGGRGNARHISLEDALLIVGIAALAIAAGMAFNSLFRAVRETGGQVTPQGLVIPLPAMATIPVAA